MQAFEPEEEPTMLDNSHPLTDVVLTIAKKVHNKMLCEKVALQEQLQLLQCKIDKQDAAIQRYTSILNNPYFQALRLHLFSPLAHLVLCYMNIMYCVTHDILYPWNSYCFLCIPCIPFQKPAKFFLYGPGVIKHVSPKSYYLQFSKEDQEFVTQILQLFERRIVVRFQIYMDLRQNTTKNLVVEIVKEGDHVIIIDLTRRDVSKPYSYQCSSFYNAKHGILIST